VLLTEQLDLLWKNTVGYLEPENLKRYVQYGCRAKRGVLLMGPPGNDKTMACRWVWEECRRRGWEWRLVTPDSYRQARASECVEALFSMQRRGIVFFDDMDLALRDRETVRETDDQAVFLSALDGIEVREGVVFVFTSNCAPELIDRAFKRPGRLDVVLTFANPTAELRRELIGRWHADIRSAVCPVEMVASTDGYSFAEIEELKNLLIMRHMEAGVWDWGWALEQFDVNRAELSSRPCPRLGFGHGERVLSSDEDEIPF
jgi:SpoVK/Ycf46/Vps4 family AAA+-type ATPase